MSKNFGYPIQPSDLAQFLCPDNGRAVEHDGLTYFSSEWWTLRTAQYCGATPSEANPLDPIMQGMFSRLEGLPESAWRPMADKRSLLDKYGAKIWERSTMRHNLYTHPIVRVGFSYAQRAILQLCAKLPNAVIYIEGGNSDPVFIKFTKGAIILRQLPWREETPVSINLWTKQ
jgi:hypothetical protein